MKVLIVDDKEEGRYLLETLLRAKGHQVTSVANGAEALERLRTDGFDLIISDILMPVMDGFELCRRVKADEALRHIPFIIYTATYTDPQDEAYALKVGADRFIMKPCEPEVFLKMVSEVMTTERRGEVKVLEKEGEEIFKLYSERLVKKLEDKMMQLEREVQARREAEKRAEDASKRWQATFDAMLDMVALLKTDGTIIQSNRAFADFYSQDGQAVVGEKCFRLVHRTDNHIQGCPLVRSLQSGARETIEMETGQKVFLVVTDPIKGPDGQVEGFVHIMRDITERKRTEETLRASETKYRKLHESMMDGFVYVDMQGVIRDCNEVYQRMLGYSFEELSKLTYIDLTPEKWHAFEQRIVEEQILPKGFSEVYEKEYRKKDGTIFPVELRTFLIKNDAGENEGMWAIVRDITERKRAEEDLRSSEERYRTLVEGTTDAILLLDSERRIVSCNQAFCKLFGYERDEIVGKSVRILHPSDKSFHSFGEWAYPTVIQEGSFRGEWNFVNKKGTEIPVEVALSVIRSSDGLISGYVSVSRDMTEHKRKEKEIASLQEQLRQSQKMEAIGSLAGGIAHDFNNILTVIKGVSQLSLLDLREGDPLHTNLKEIERSAEKAADLT